MLRFKALLLDIRKRKPVSAHFPQSASNAKQPKDAKIRCGYLSLEQISDSELEIIKFCQRQRYREEFSFPKRDRV